MCLPLLQVLSAFKRIHRTKAEVFSGDEAALSGNAESMSLQVLETLYAKVVNASTLINVGDCNRVRNLSEEIKLLVSLERAKKMIFISN